VSEAVDEILREAQHPKKPTDEGKPELVFLALLRSQPSLSGSRQAFPMAGFSDRARPATPKST
jgi:hypothetical protein